MVHWLTLSILKTIVFKVAGADYPSLAESLDFVAAASGQAALPRKDLRYFTKLYFEIPTGTQHWDEKNMGIRNFIQFELNILSGRLDVQSYEFQAAVTIVAQASSLLSHLLHTQAG
ncbi:MAG TPA: hypothetical protein DIV79_07310 [Opitutae bacterium]|nr:hypothetical protein [Opitutae bacterium]